MDNNNNNNIDVPEYFICPISLQIMKDPVTTTSGITYDRESIERWLFKSNNTICPVTKQPLPRDSDSITPNHTLRRLIQSWCSLNQTDRIPTPKPPLTKSHLINLIRDLSNFPHLQTKTLEKLEALAMENDRNKAYMVEAGLASSLISFIVSCHKRHKTEGLGEALSLFYLVRGHLGQSNGPLTEDDDVIDSLTWILGCDNNDVVVKSHAAHGMRVVIHKSKPSTLERLSPHLFKTVLSELRVGTVSQQGTRSLLHVLHDACPWGRNRILMVESGAVRDLIEVELMRSPPEKKTTELVLGILYHLCSCADGRAQLLSHPGGVAVASRPILRVSPTADDRAVWIIWLIAKYSGTNGVLEEMLRVGSVSKLCMVMQADCAWHVKERAREILRTHSDVWKDSPCIELGLS